MELSYPGIYYYFFKVDVRPGPSSAKDVDDKSSSGSRVAKSQEIEEVRDLSPPTHISYSL